MEGKSILFSRNVPSVNLRQGNFEDDQKAKVEKEKVGLIHFSLFLQRRTGARKRESATTTTSINTNQKEEIMEIKRIAISKIIGSLCKMRLEKDYEAEALLESISDRGVMNPVKVMPVKNGYLIFAGHRRLVGAKELRHKTITAEVWDDLEDRDAALMGFVENINRKDFTRLEEGYAYQKLVKEYGYSVDDLIKPCGKSRARIYILISLVKNLTPAMKKAIIAGKMTSGHGEYLLRIEDPKRRKECFELVLAKEMDLADLKYEVYRQKPDEEKNEQELQLDIIEDICEEDATIRSMWNKSIEVRRSRKGLKITIEVDGPHDLLYKFSTISGPVKKKLDLFNRFKKKL